MEVLEDGRQKKCAGVFLPEEKNKEEEASMNTDDFDNVFVP